MKSYRIDAPRPPRKTRTMQDTITPGQVVVHNGTTASLAIPCFYQEMHRPVPAVPHDRMLHDMLGWPTPDHPDHSCQEWDFDRHACRRTPHMKCDPPHCDRYVDMGALLPVHLAEEGYGQVEVELQTPIVEASARIDEDQDWIVRVMLESELDMSVTTKRTTSMAVYVISDERRDMVALVRVVVLPTGLEDATEA